MIQANELRVNQTYLWSNEIVTLERDDLRNILELEQEENLSGIPLTPEILQKCGFEDFDNDWFVIKNREIELSIDIATSQLSLGKAEYFLGSNIKFLHQLQNLYHTLTGQELNIDLSIQVSDTTKA